MAGEEVDQTCLGYSCLLIPMSITQPQIFILEWAEFQLESIVNICEAYLIILPMTPSFLVPRPIAATLQRSSSQFQISSCTDAASSCGPGLWVAVTTSVMLLYSLLSFQLPRQQHYNSLY